MNFVRDLRPRSQLILATRSLCMRLLSAIVLMGTLGGCSLVAGSGDGLPCDPACDANASCVLGRCVVPTPRRIAKECVEGEDETQCGPNE